jgi:hypothetical protein
MHPYITEKAATHIRSGGVERNILPLPEIGPNSLFVQPVTKWQYGLSHHDSVLNKIMITFLCFIHHLLTSSVAPKKQRHLWSFFVMNTISWL